MIVQTHRFRATVTKVKPVWWEMRFSNIWFSLKAEVRLWCLNNKYFFFLTENLIPIKTLFISGWITLKKQPWALTFLIVNDKRQLYWPFFMPIVYLFFNLNISRIVQCWRALSINSMAAFARQAAKKWQKVEHKILDLLYWHKIY